MSPQQASKQRIEMYDTTLRDGVQGEGVAFSLVEKLKIAKHLDQLGVDFIEGGYPLSNPKDAAFFDQTAKMTFDHARICAFGMTRRRGVKPHNDPGMAALVAARAPVITIVGKTWDLHVDEVLQVDREENLDMICETLDYLRKQTGCEVFYDAEHFFDGYRDNRDYALATLRAAVVGGATRVILCDTNGGSLPDFIEQAVREVGVELGEQVKLGIHTHNDSGLATANTLAAVRAGAVQVQGTINGVGERCGNVDLTTVVANLRLKMGCDCLTPEALTHLTRASRFVYEMANMNLTSNQPFVGSAAFAHKGGMHVHAVQRIAHSYEHVEPESVGNSRRVLVSELSGTSNLAATLGAKFEQIQDRQLQRKLLQRIQALEHEGYQFEAAQASFELLWLEMTGNRPCFWELDHYRCVIYKSDGQEPITEAIVKLKVDGRMEHRVAEGDGPVNALDGALRKCLAPRFPQIADVHLRDYKVRVVNPTAESAAKVRVIAEFAVKPDAGDEAGGQTYFTTIGVNENIVEASWRAITDAFVYHLAEAGCAKQTDSATNP